MKKDNDKNSDYVVMEKLDEFFLEVEEEYLHPILSEKGKEELKPDPSPNDEAATISNILSPDYVARERKTVSDFLSTPCSCGEDCQKYFSVSDVMEARQNFLLMSRSEQHSFIIGKLQSFMRVSDLAVSARKSRLRERRKYDYFIYADRPVCREMFLFYYGESIDKLKRRQKYLNEVGTLPPNHGNTGKTPHHACKPKAMRYVKKFIESFAAIHGLPDPGRDLRAEKGKVRIYLPTVMNYMHVYRIFEKSLAEEERKIFNVKYQTFRRLWIKHFPNIVFSKPRSDVCMTCEDNKKLINAAVASGDENQKLEALTIATEHIKVAKKERDYYRTSIENAKNSYHNSLRENEFGAINPSETHYSWDFAQQLHYPYESYQVGPIFFKTPRVAQLFGVCCEAIPQQVNYLIDEADFPRKGADTVISLLDHYFEHHSLHEEHAFLTADNCVGQNKNNAILQYLMYRVMTGKHKSITLSFMMVGHTKFAPDGYFGLIKKKYRRSNVYTFDHLIETISSSTKNNYNICQTYRNNAGKVNYQYREWGAWLARFFNNLPGIKNYQHFFITSTSPGIIAAKDSVDGKEVLHSILKKDDFNFIAGSKVGEPKLQKTERMSAKRQWYLYNSIRQHIPREEDKDSTAPLPKVPRPSKTE